MRPPQIGDHATTGCSLQEAELEQVGLVDVLDRVGLLAECDGDRGETDGAAAELEGDRLEELAVDPLEAPLVDLVELERIDRELLETIAFKFGGGPVGLSTIAVALGEETDTVEDVYEPYLLQLGFLQRTPRGRVITDLGRAHLGAVRDEDSLF